MADQNHRPQSGDRNLNYNELKPYASQRKGPR